MNQFTREQVHSAGGKFYSGERYATITLANRTPKVELIWNAETGTVHRLGGEPADALDIDSLSRLTTQPQPTKQANHANGKVKVLASDLDHAWFESAYSQLMSEAANLADEKVSKPGSQISIHMAKLASLIKGTSNPGVTPSQAFNDLMKAYPYRNAGNRYGDPLKAYEYQWNRAMKIARPRQREVTFATPPNPPQKPISRPTKPAPAPPQPTTETEPKKPEGEKPSLNMINIKNPKTKDYITAFNYLGFSFRLNQLDDTIECNNEPLTDGSAARIRNLMRDIGLTSPPVIQDVWLQLAYEKQYHPVHDYLSGLVWDGKDHIGTLMTYFTETTGFGEVAFTRWLIGSVAKVMQAAQNFMMVLDGPQGVGKSRLARWLCPLPKYFAEGAINTEDKDYLVRLCTTWIWEVGELQATTRRADREALKDFITKREITVRKAYARYDIVKPAMASFIGTINEDGGGFLTDRTGNRRFVILRLQEINWSYEKEMDASQLWAQAVHLYRTGMGWQLTPEESTGQEKIQANYESTTPLEDMFFELFTIDSNASQYMTSIEIIKRLEDNGLKGNQNQNFKDLKTLLQRLKVPKGRPRVGDSRVWSYRGIINRTDANQAPPSGANQ